jgi:hypothetical protein
MGKGFETGNRRRRLTRHFSAIALSLAAAPLILAPAPAGATVTVGQVGTPISCAPADYVQPTVTGGNSYVVKGDGAIVSWSTRAFNTGGAALALKVLRPVSGLTYTVVGQDTRFELAPAVLNTFPTYIPVKAGDVLGTNAVANGAACVFDAPGETRYFAAGNQTTGGQVTFTPQALGQRVNAMAEVLPTSAFTVGGTALNKKKGTATLSLGLPGPGEVTVAGDGVREASASGAIAAATVNAAGTFDLTIKAKGQKRKRLRRAGKVKLEPLIAYTPTGGTTHRETTQVKLKKKK